MYNPTSLFTLIIPGQPCITNFEQIGDNLIYDLTNPIATSSIGMALNCPLPEGYAASLYYSLPPFTDLQFLGKFSMIIPFITTIKSFHF